MRRSPKGVNKVYMQKDNPEGWDTLLEYVKKCMPEAADIHDEKKKRAAKKREAKVKKQEETQLSYQVHIL